VLRRRAARNGCVGFADKYVSIPGIFPGQEVTLEISVVLPNNCPPLKRPVLRALVVGASRVGKAWGYPNCLEILRGRV
jgi:hypothetical protein